MSTVGFAQVKHIIVCDVDFDNIPRSWVTSFFCFANRLSNSQTSRLYIELAEKSGWFNSDKDSLRIEANLSAMRSENK